MRIAVLNFSGNVGKTTIAGHLLKPRMPQAKIYSIESINIDGNSDGLDVEKMRGKKFGNLVDELMVTKEAIIDVGASNVEDFIKLMQHFDNSHEEFDLFIIPVVKEKKVQSDTINTILALNKLGVTKEKIRVIFNKLDIDEEPKEEFAAIFGAAEMNDSFLVNEKSVIYINEVFDRLKTIRKSLMEISQDTTDYKERLKEEINDEERTLCVRMIALKRLATTANRNLDSVFQTIKN
jgi:DNA-binding transcriptional MerR regulator